ncbi:hypothetical protein FRB94_002369 [Tulasnella sp. JGI-2019a]|nr:hypothetical protein FRB93_004414 [Tulasnella sp. JGI-2019a]KAG9004425.1 hypothetical protein FRB94_002369 [Tulasnella sp. JGI-2019a]KAG9031650.1 hypothetical protein FRB95_002459 [Tulasnella sp. JGI-2019a]
MTLRAVFFDIGGVVVKSPLVAIFDYEKDLGLPPSYLNVQISRQGAQGAWARFERGELDPFTFYDLFGKELSDTVKGNQWYREHCEQRNIPCPPLPSAYSYVQIDGRELFGLMMRGGTYDMKVVEAIRTIKATGRWKVIALTNNYHRPFADLQAKDPELAKQEMEHLGWNYSGGPASDTLKGMFHDFVDSSEVGSRKPEPHFYLHACEKHGLKPSEVVFLDDLGVNLKTGKQLGMETIHVPIGKSEVALEKLQERLGVQLLEGAWTPKPSSKL